MCVQTYSNARRTRCRDLSCEPRAGSRLSKHHARLAWPMSPRHRLPVRSSRLAPSAGRGTVACLVQSLRALWVRRQCALESPFSPSSVSRMLRPPPFSWMLRLLVVFLTLAHSHARQPLCRLIPKLDVQLGGDHPQLPFSANPTGSASQPSQTGSASPSITPFNYGQDTIRGVNLRVFLLPLSRTLAKLFRTRGGWFVLEVRSVLRTHVMLADPRSALDNSKYLREHE